ncbi:tripartite tricarboxylate transporter permease [Allopusillimonas ginsengisoli]|uniref:tripartite tricarboxylate transporter permease n=1 Tax=Allopusillimonas ginsengisoli TaxID=453575 RepID=UPI00101F9B35|nr:tripartite tricarboxylate transporter permease [Allopusillimonas ginsengisoli]TEA74270.1 C4-dicarboxylate ABC transporter permease [Allopusillimonas ginsengisoli]
MSGFEFVIEVLSPANFLIALAGVSAGIVIGAMPGLTATMAVAVLVPFTFGAPPATALIALGAIYTGAIYGGAYAAILLNTPGTPSAIATTFDGYPMAKKGDGDLALTLACVASVFGGLVGAAFLILLAPPLATFALRFGPVEYFWLAMFGLTLISSLAAGSLIKAAIGGCIGLLLSMIGLAEVGGDVRFTGGSQTLLGGLDIVSALIGLYCVPVLIDLVATPNPHMKMGKHGAGYRLAEALSVCWKGRINLIRSSVIGTVVGILPGAGGSIAALVSYSESRRSSKTPELYGTGVPDAVVATESANNATVGGGFVPTLVLGIPGTPPDAVILGALLVQGIRVGPQLFTEQSEIVFTFMYGLILATVLMLPVGLFFGRYAFRLLVAVPKAVLAPSVAFLTVLGSYAVNNNANDVILMVVLGGIGWWLARFGFSQSPIVLGLILGSIAESGFVQGYLIGNARGNVLAEFFTRPLSIGIIMLVLVTLMYPLLRQRLKKKKGVQS